LGGLIFGITILWGSLGGYLAIYAFEVIWWFDEVYLCICVFGG